MIDCDFGIKPLEKNQNKLSRWRELNSRPLPYQGSALPLSYIGLVGGESRIRTYEGIRQQIYSLPQLAALVSPQHF